MATSWQSSDRYDGATLMLSLQMMIHATMQIYEKAMSDFLPTPSKSHYIFNLRDFARVMRGVLLVPAERMTEPDKLIRLWIHEVYRVFNDRLTEDTDRFGFDRLARTHYCTDPDVTWGCGRGCPLVVHYWADLQSLRCYGNRTRTEKCAVTSLRPSRDLTT